jgi:hypothetical protein
MSRSHPISRSTDLYRDIEVYSHHHLSRRRNSLNQLPLFYHDEHLGIGHLLFYRKSSQRGRRRDCRMDSQTDHLRGGHMWIRTRANIQQQSQGTWGCRIETKRNQERIRTRAAQCTRHGLVLIFRTKIWYERQQLLSKNNVEEIFQGLDRFE